MNIMIVGLGSMGQRRLRLLMQRYPGYSICGVDANPTRREAAAEKWNIPVYEGIAQAVTLAHPEAAVISTSPLSHAAIIRECLEAGLHIFTELNLVADGYEEAIALAEQAKRVLFLSSTFLYREETKYLCQAAQASQVPVNYRYHVGQYLPDWHPWEDYTRYFVGDMRTNGCRELLAIELPWLTAAFGDVLDVQVLKSKMTGLKIAYNDSIMLLLRHVGGHMGSLCIDVVSRKAVRLFEMYSEQAYLAWEGTPDTLTSFDPVTKEERGIILYEQAEHQDGYAAFVVENAYAAELTAFIEAIEQGKKPVYGFREDEKVLRLIDQIEGKQ